MLVVLLVGSWTVQLESFCVRCVRCVQARGSAVLLSAVSSPRDALLSGVGKAVQAATAAAGAVLLLRRDEARAEGVRPVITSKVFIDVKIANYTEESIGANRGATGSGRLVIGLFGNDAPLSVKRFLSVIDGDGVNSPNFINTQFAKIGPDGLLEIERVRGLNKVQLAGQEEYEYQGNLLPEYANPILESNDIRHDRRGLLTRRKLTSTPEFGITLAGDKGSSLDGFHCVFGEVVEGFEVLDAVGAVPTYSYSTSTGYLGKTREAAEEDLANKWFSAQKDFYVNAGKAFGDNRAVDQRGKLLRRCTIVKAGRL